jgi:hypothetical protein
MNTTKTGLPERKGFRATIVTGDRNIFYANFKASDKSDAYEEFVNILLGLDFLICEDETAIRCSTVTRFTIDVAPTPEEEVEEAKRVINNYLANKKYDYDIKLLLTVFGYVVKKKSINMERALMKTVDDLFVELSVINKYEPLEGK